MRTTAFSRTARSVLANISLTKLGLACLLCLIHSPGAWAWGYQGHRVVGSIADQLLKPNAAAQVQQILNAGESRGLTLKLSAPWADCVKSVKRNSNDTFEYVVDPEHYDYEVPCRPFKSEAERARMVDYLSRNWSNCLYQPDGPDRPASGCHNTFHFDDVAIQRDRFDRSFQGSNEHDLVAAIGAVIAVLRD